MGKGAAMKPASSPTHCQWSHEQKLCVTCKCMYTCTYMYMYMYNYAHVHIVHAHVAHSAHVSYIRGDLGRSSTVDHGENGQEESSRLPRASLSTGHEVSLALDDRQSILLHWCGPLVLGHLQQERRQHMYRL